MKKFVFYALIIMALVACGDDNRSPAAPQPANTGVSRTPKPIAYQLLNIHPHDSTCYTEGLQFINGQFLESAGQYGKSDIRFTDIKTGKILRSAKMSAKYFGEGCTLLNGKIYQMTYRESTCFVYDSATLKKMGEFNYDFGEGWGMCTDGKNLIITTGSNLLYYYDPLTFKQIKRVGVTNEYGGVNMLNELEFIKGFIYVNKFETDTILKVDPGTGNVVGIIDLSDLRIKLNIPPMTYEGQGKEEDGDAKEPTSPELFNGIAYDSLRNSIFVTGKRWPKVAEVRFDN